MNFAIEIAMRAGKWGVLGDGTPRCIMREIGYWCRGRWQDGDVVFSMRPLADAPFISIEERDIPLFRDLLPSIRMIEAESPIGVYVAVNERDYILMTMIAE